MYKGRKICVLSASVGQLYSTLQQRLHPVSNLSIQLQDALSDVTHDPSTSAFVLAISL
jgi:hypothetical protein